MKPFGVWCHRQKTSVRSWCPWVTPQEHHSRAHTDDALIQAGNLPFIFSPWWLLFLGLQCGSAWWCVSVHGSSLYNTAFTRYSMRQERKALFCISSATACPKVQNSLWRERLALCLFPRVTIWLQTCRVYEVKGQELRAGWSRHCSGYVDQERGLGLDDTGTAEAPQAGIFTKERNSKVSTEPPQPRSPKKSAVREWKWGLAWGERSFGSRGWAVPNAAALLADKGEAWAPSGPM